MPQAEPRPLLIAEQANPEWVSVPLVGWSHARAIQKLCPGAHLVTQVRNREAILRAGLVEGEDFTAIDTEKISGPVHRMGERLRGGAGKGWTTVTALASPGYYYFEHRVRKAFEPRIKAGEFNLVHRITPLSPTTPSWSLPAMCRRRRVPWVIGPLNGGAPWPPGFDEVRREEKEYLSYVRGAYRLLPGYGRARRWADAILIASRQTLEQLPIRFRDRVIYMPENGIDPDRFNLRRTGPVNSPLRAVFIGRLTPYKGPDMLLRAAAPLIRAGRLRVEFCGDGPMMPTLKAIAREEQLPLVDPTPAGTPAAEINRNHAGVELAGHVAHTELQRKIVACDLLAFPSIREFGGGVVLEAMAVGLVPVIVDYAGPAELVTPRTGVAIRLGSREQIIRDLRSALEQLIADPARVQRLSEAAYRRVWELFTWEAKARNSLSVYRWLLDKATYPRPDFPIPLPDPPGVTEPA